jgi:hypothetical protein
MTNDRLFKKIMSLDNDVYRIGRKSKRYLGKDVKEYLGITKINNWKKRIQNGVKFKEVVV